MYFESYIYINLCFQSGEKAFKIDTAKHIQFKVGLYIQFKVGLYENVV